MTDASAALLDWLYALHSFQTRYEASELARLLRRAQSRARTASAGLQPGEALPVALTPASDKLYRLSQSVHLNRPLEAMEQAYLLAPLLEKAAQESRAWARPFGLLVDQLREEVVRFAHPAPRALDPEQLARQRAYLRHCYEKGLLLQAVTLGREWLISWVVLRAGLSESWVEYSTRHTAEEWLNDAVRRGSRDPGGALRAEAATTAEDGIPSAAAPPLPQDVVDAWNYVYGLRNDLAHCGFRTNPVSALSLQERVHQLVELLEAIPL